jgi:lipopolysaccharide export system permease protein
VLLGILQRYTLREILGPTLLGLIVCTFLLLVREIFRMMDLLVNTSVTVFEAFEVIACLLPTLLTLTVPMALLVGVLLGLGRMASENEIIAIRTSGVHLWRIYWPIIAVCALVSGAMIVTNQALTPSLALRAADVELRIWYKLANAFEPGRVYTDFAKDNTQAAIYFRKRDPKNGDLRDVTMKLGNAEQGSLNDSEIFISAPRGRLIPDEKNVTLSFVLEDGTLHFRSQNPQRANEYDVATFARLTRATPLDIGKRTDAGAFKRTEAMMTVGQLRRAIAEAEKFDRLWRTLAPEEFQARVARGEAGTYVKEKYLRRYRVELAQRFSIPMACVAVILLAIPLALYIRPSAKTLGFAVALALTFTYYVLVQWGVKLALSDSPVGTTMIFMPNFLLGGIGAFLMVRTVRQ